MQIHQLKRKTPNKKSVQVGRGGTRGKTAGRGTKGQKARAGHKIRPEFRDALEKIPKLRGFDFISFQKKEVGVNLYKIDSVFGANEIVSPKTLAEKGVVQKKSGVFQPIKILSVGEITKAITVSGCKVSATAKAKIEKAGGKVE